MSFVMRVLWKQPLSAFSWPKRGVFWFVRLLFSLFGDLVGGQMSLRAMSMVYTTLISLVPLLALSFSVLKGFGVHNQLEPLLLELLAPLGQQAGEITEQVLGFVSNMEVGVLGAVGMGILVYTVLALIHKIVTAIEFTWDNRGGRAGARRLLDYFALLMLGPLVLFALIGVVSGAVDTVFVQSILKVTVIESMYVQLLRWLPLMLMALALTFIYWFVPSAGVKWYAALAGGVVAAGLWKVSGWIFTAVVVGSGNYAAIYSAFASVLLFMVWVYVSWLIFLLGSRLAYYVQYPEAMRPRAAQSISAPADLTLTGLNVMRVIGVAFKNHQLPPQSAVFEREFEQPQVMIEYVLQRLVVEGVIRSDIDQGYFPAKPMEDVKMVDVVQALWQAENGVLSGGREIQLMNDINRSVFEGLADLSLAGFIEGE